MDATRSALIEAAATVFADHGYAGGSIRAITRLASANQAAVTYHFGGNAGLYHAVLQAGLDELERDDVLDDARLSALPVQDALRLVIRRFLAPLTQPGRLGRTMRIFGRESLEPSPAYLDFVRSGTPRPVAVIERLVRRLLPPEATPREVALTTFWLLQQPVAMVREAGRLRHPPFNLSFDAATVDMLVDMLGRLAAHGLAGRARPSL